MMKTKLLMLVACLFTGSLAFGQKAKSEKDTVTYVVSMSCANCQKRIEDNISFEKGVTGLKVNLQDKTVAIEYRKDKTTPQKLKAAIQKLGYTAMPFHPKKEGGNTGK